MPSILLTSIIKESRIQPRESIQEATVAEYAQSMKMIETLREHGIERDAFPPVVVFQDDAGYCWLADGWHRVLAAERAGYQEIEADVIRGDIGAAIIYAAGANAQHGLRRTNRDKHRAVSMLLEHPKIIGEQWSDMRVAIAAGVGTSMVRQIRLERSRKLGLPVETKRLGADGKLYTNSVRSPQESSLEPVTATEPEPTDPNAVTLHSCPSEGCGAILTVSVMHCSLCGSHWPLGFERCRSCEPGDGSTDWGKPILPFAYAFDQPLPETNGHDGVKQAAYSPGVFLAGEDLKALERFDHALGLIKWCKSTSASDLAATIPPERIEVSMADIQDVIGYLNDVWVAAIRSRDRQTEAATIR
jgi:hypothetical protein